MKTIRILALAALAVLPAAGETLRIPMQRVSSMDPLRAATVYDARAVSLVYETLLEIDYFARPYRLKAGICSLPKVSDDLLEYVFTLCEGARFHDDPCFPGGKGRAVTAHDVVYSLKRLGDLKNASSGMWLMDMVESVEATDARTVKIRLKKPFHVFPWLMALSYTGTVAREAVEKYGDRFGGSAVGTGPYKLASWRRNHRMRFVRDPNWRGWRDIPSKPFDEIEYLVIDDASTKWLMFYSGELDHLGELSPDNWDVVVTENGELNPELKAKGMVMHSAPTMSVMYIGVNMNDPVLGKNKKLRQALNCAFDFPAWSRFLNDRVMPCDGPVPPGVEGRLVGQFKYGYDLEKAKRLLAEAGYPGGRDPATGKRLEISISVGRATQAAREQLELMQSFYSRIGIHLEPRYMTWDAYLKAINEGRVALFLMGWVGDYPDAENFLQLFHSKNVSPGANHCNYRNPEFDRLYDEAMAATDKEKRNEAWRKAQAIVCEDCPWIYQHFSLAYSVLWDHVLNYRLTDFPYGGEKHFSCGQRKTPAK